MAKTIKKKKKVRNTLLPFFEKVLKNKRIKYKILESDNEFTFVETKLSGNAFHRMIEKAMCEKQKQGKNKNIISFKEWLENPWEYGSFQILKKDTEKFTKSIL